MESKEKIKDIEKPVLIAFLKKHLLEMLMDIGQKLTTIELGHLVTRTYEVLKKSHSQLNLNELMNVFEVGMNQGFGTYRKLTVQIIREWLYLRQKEMFQKREADANNEKYEWLKKDEKTYNSPLGKIVILKYSMSLIGHISDAVYYKFTCKMLYDKFPKASISEIKEFLLEEQNKLNYPEQYKDLLEDVEIEDLPENEFENNENF